MLGELVTPGFTGLILAAGEDGTACRVAGGEVSVEWTRPRLLREVAAAADATFGP